MTRHSLARRERHDLCDLALALGEDADTLCGTWDAKDLVAHLLVREHRPLGAIGIVVPPLAGLAEREMARVRRRDFAVLVERLRDPSLLTPYALPGVEELLNTAEYFVHHEDLRRAQAGWEPRVLDPTDESRLWAAIKVAGRGLVRPAGVPVRIERTDTGATATLRRGADPAVVSGLPSEIAFFLFGRDAVRGLSFSGPQERVAKLRRSDLGI
ncbi:TIGR03085 family protein [Nocardioides sp. KIGAM211]|uniref:TIGR03085 family protein n=1 Tax=Nocardioides luti TaxID=2761101 RepID=A0A7X0RFY8_9ACTN|nr:TIGR03085 family metal-binding protein [Nocardioides luti]MBB6626314.1 TIGR03085 family protein [Nocardioides luti]